MKYNLQGEEVLQNMAFNPTLSQEQAARTFAEYMGDDYPYSVFLLKGYAGTGKTTLLDAITRTMEDIGLNCELLATTGRAAKVLAQATGRTATTIHRKSIELLQHLSRKAVLISWLLHRALPYLLSMRPQ